MNFKAFLREYAAPATKSQGMARSGKDFKLTSSSGNIAILFFEEIRTDPLKVIFEVSYCIAPAAYWAWLTRYDGERVRNIDRSGALITRFVLPPEELSSDPDGEGYFRRMWSYGADTEKKCGSTLGELLSREVIPEMDRILDGKSLLSELLEPTRPGVSALSQDLCEILLGMESMTSGKLEELLTGAEQNGAFDPLVSWIRQRSRPGS